MTDGPEMVVYAGFRDSGKGGFLECFAEASLPMQSGRPDRRIPLCPL